MITEKYLQQKKCPKNQSFKGFQEMRLVYSIFECAFINQWIVQIKVIGSDLLLQVHSALSVIGEHFDLNSNLIVLIL